MADEGKTGEAMSADGEAGEDGKESVPAIKAAPAILGTKGSFQEVLARRQAQLAALKNKTAAGASRAASAGRCEYLAAAAHVEPRAGTF